MKPKNFVSLKDKTVKRSWVFREYEEELLQGLPAERRLLVQGPSENRNIYSRQAGYSTPTAVKIGAPALSLRQFFFTRSLSLNLETTSGI
jgi:hypothetical protein